MENPKLPPIETEVTLKKYEDYVITWDNFDSFLREIFSNNVEGYVNGYF